MRLISLMQLGIKKREFSDLVQQTMTVEEYAAKFVELSRFAPYLIPNEPKKVSKFQKCLNDKIFPHIIASKCVLLLRL